MMSKENILNQGSSHSSGHGFFRKEESANVIQLRKVVADKDRQLAFLERKLVLAQAEVKTLQENEQKIKLAEKSAKIQLSAKQTAVRRQSIALMQASATISRLNSRDKDRERRMHLRRDELERELEAAEDLADAIREDSEKRTRDQLAAHDEEVKQLRISMDELSGDLYSREAKHAVELEELQISKKSLQESVHSLEELLRVSVENEQRLSLELDECLELNSSLTKDLCSLRVRQVESPARDLRSKSDHATQTEAVETETTIDPTPSALGNVDELSALVARLEAECGSANAQLWRLQDQLDLERDGWAQREAQLQSALSGVSGAKLRLEAELQGSRRSEEALESALAAALTEQELRDVHKLSSQPTLASRLEIDDDEVIAKLRQKDEEIAQLRMRLEDSTFKRTTTPAIDSDLSTGPQPRVDGMTSRSSAYKDGEDSDLAKSNPPNIEIQRLVIQLAMIHEAFEATRGVQVQDAGSDCKTIKDLQQLLQRSDAELIRRASKNASLQFEVNRLTELLTESDDNSLRSETARLKLDLSQLTSKYEKVHKLNYELMAKLSSYHEITEVLHKEQREAYAAIKPEYDPDIGKSNLSFGDSRLNGRD